MKLVMLRIHINLIANDIVKFLVQFISDNNCKPKLNILNVNYYRTIVNGVTEVLVKVYLVQMFFVL